MNEEVNRQTLKELREENKRLKQQLVDSIKYTVHLQEKLNYFNRVEQAWLRAIRHENNCKTKCRGPYDKCSCYLEMLNYINDDSGDYGC